jgi:TolA-binding protein
MPQPPPPYVFISYSWDSDENKQRVLELTAWLRGSDCGVNAWLDEYETSPAETWPIWCNRQIEKAKFVLVVCTETYKRRVLREEEPGAGQPTSGRGATWEGAIITNELYDSTKGQTKYVPIVFANKDVAYVPFFLKGFSVYNAADDKSRAELSRALRGLPPHVPVPVGQRLKLSPQQLNKPQPVAAPPAVAYNHGVLFQQQRDYGHAKDAYKMAIASGDADIAPKAAFNLGRMLYDLKDYTGAKEAYRIAIASDDVEVAPVAAFSLGVLLQEQGDYGGAKAAYASAIASGHGDPALQAMVMLGNVLQEQKDYAGAEVAFSRAIASGQTDIVPVATFNLGNLRKAQGDTAGAESAYRAAISSGHAEVSQRATAALEELLSP